MWEYVGIALLVLGGLICGLNFYFSFLRFPLHRLRGGRRETYRWESGIPLFGSLFVAISLIWGWHSAWWLWLGIGLIVIDTGGPQWFVIAVVGEWLRPPGPRGTAPPG